MGRFNNSNKTLLRYLNTKTYLSKSGISNLKSEFEKFIIVERGKKKTINKFWCEFDLTPTDMSREYKILITHIEGYTPYVYILSPNVSKLSENINEKIPHLYDYKRHRLCLFFPYTNEFSFEQNFAGQLLPWTILWLFYFETWLATGEWKGGGYHPDDDIVMEEKNKLDKKTSSKQKKSKPKKTIAFALSESNKIYEQRIKKRVIEI
jgi:hypothetical protein